VSPVIVAGVFVALHTASTARASIRKRTKGAILRSAVVHTLTYAQTRLDWLDTAQAASTRSHSFTRTPLPAHERLLPPSSTRFDHSLPELVHTPWCPRRNCQSSNLSYSEFSGLSGGRSGASARPYTTIHAGPSSANGEGDGGTTAWARYGLTGGS
jgi:hypothetical protein